jgi:branched-chain amino acid aminotransferase
MTKFASTSMEDRDGQIWINGEMVNWRDAKFHMLAHTLHHGLGVFEGVRAYLSKDGRPAIFRLEEHTKRLFRSAHIMQIPLPYEESDLFDAQIEVMRRNSLEEAYLRPIVFYGGDRMGVSAQGNRVHVSIAAWLWENYLGETAKADGVKLKISSFTRHHVNSTMCKAKVCGHYVNSVLANQEAKQLGFDDAMLLDVHGYVAEATTSNVFVIIDGDVFTPPLHSVLAGVTRDSVIKLLEHSGIPCTERTMTRDDLYIADEIFLTGTASEITPVVEVDNRSIGGGRPGKVSKHAQELYFQAVRGEISDFHHWLTHI